MKTDKTPPAFVGGRSKICMSLIEYGPMQRLVDARQSNGLSQNGAIQ